MASNWLKLTRSKAKPDNALDQEVLQQADLLCEVEELIDETAQAKSVCLRIPDHEKIDFQPGQFCNLWFQIKGKWMERSYSISSVPEELPLLRFTVKRIKGGVVSGFVNKQLKAGDKIALKKPEGTFIRPKLEPEQEMIMFAAGSGITPIHSLIKQEILKGKNRIRLFYVSRSADDAIFLNALIELMEKNPEQLLLHTYFTAEEGKRPGKKDLAAIIKKAPAQSHFFICGPDGFMDRVTFELVKHNIPLSNIRKERFVNFSLQNGVDYREIPAAERPYELKIQLKGQETTTLAGAHTPILTAGLNEKLRLKYSCRSGGCTSCASRLKQGKVYDMVSKKTIDAPAEEVLICSCLPISDDVIIEQAN